MHIMEMLMVTAGAVVFCVAVIAVSYIRANEMEKSEAEKERNLDILTDSVVKANDQIVNAALRIGQCEKRIGELQQKLNDMEAKYSGVEEAVMKRMDARWDDAVSKVMAWDPYKTGDDNG